MSIFRRTQRRKGQALIETAVGLIALVPIVLCMVDITTLILAVSQNENLARNAAQAGAKAALPDSAGDEATARQAAYNAIARLGTSSIIPERRLISFSYDGNPRNPNLDPGSAVSARGQVNATTLVRVVPPAPFPFFSEATFISKSTATIVSREPLRPPVVEAVPAEAVQVPIGP